MNKDILHIQDLFSVAQGDRRQILTDLIDTHVRYSMTLEDRVAVIEAHPIDLTGYELTKKDPLLMIQEMAKACIRDYIIWNQPGPLRQ